MTALLHTPPLTTVLLVVGIVLLRPFAARLRRMTRTSTPSTRWLFAARRSFTASARGGVGDHLGTTRRARKGTFPARAILKSSRIPCVTCRNSSEAVPGVKWFALIRLYWNRRRRTSDAALAGPQIVLNGGVVVNVYSSIMIGIRQDLPSPDGSLEPIKHIAAQADTGKNDGY